MKRIPLNGCSHTADNATLICTTDVLLLPGYAGYYFSILARGGFIDMRDMQGFPQLLPLPVLLDQYPLLAMYVRLRHIEQT